MVSFSLPRFKDPKKCAQVDVSVSVVGTFSGSGPRTRMNNRNDIAISNIHAEYNQMQDSNPLRIEDRRTWKESYHNLLERDE